MNNLIASDLHQLRIREAFLDQKFLDDPEVLAQAIHCCLIRRAMTLGLPVNGIPSLIPKSDTTGLTSPTMNELSARNT